MTFRNVDILDDTSAMNMYSKSNKCLYGISTMLDMEKTPSHIPISNGHGHRGKFDATLNNCIKPFSIENELCPVDKNLKNLRRTNSTEPTSYRCIDNIKNSMFDKETLDSQKDPTMNGKKEIIFSGNSTSPRNEIKSSQSSDCNTSHDRHNTSSPNIIVDKKRTVEQIQNQLFNASNIKRSCSLGRKPSFKREKHSSVVTNCLNKFEMNNGESINVRISNGKHVTDTSLGDVRQCSTLPRKWKTKNNGFVAKQTYSKSPKLITENGNEKCSVNQGSSLNENLESKIPQASTIKNQNKNQNKENINGHDDKKIDCTNRVKPPLVRRNTVDDPCDISHERLTERNSSPGLLKNRSSQSIDFVETNPFSLTMPTKILNKPRIDKRSSINEDLLSNTTHRKLERVQPLAQFTPISPKPFKEIKIQMKKPNDLKQAINHDSPQNESLNKSKEDNLSIQIENSERTNGISNEEENRSDDMKRNISLSSSTDDQSQLSNHSIRDNKVQTVTEEDFRNTSFIASMQSAKECRQRRRKASVERSKPVSSKPIDITPPSRPYFQYDREFRRRPCSTGSMDKILEVEETEEDAAYSRKIRTASLEIRSFYSLPKERKRKEAVNDDGTRIPYDVFRGSVDSPDSLRKRFPPNEKIEFPECPRLSFRSYSNGESYTLKLQKEEQDLGSDAENVPSYCDSITGESPLNSVERLPSFSEISQDRRGSAPASLFKRRSIRSSVIDENGIESRRRNSSVEERLNHVRFDLEKSFQKEEKIYEQKMEIEVQQQNEVLFNAKEFMIIDNSNSNDKKVSQKNRKCSVVDMPHDEEQDNCVKITKHRKFSLPEQHFVPSFRTDDDKLMTINESRSKDLPSRKLSIPDVVFSSPMTRRKKGKVDKKSSLLDEENPPNKKQPERKTSITDTIRSVVGQKNKNERKVSTTRTLPIITAESDPNSPTENKKTKWYSIKERLRNSSHEVSASPKSSPRLSKGSMHRHDSTSSAEGLTPRLRKKFYNRSSWNRGSAEFDSLSIDSFGTSDKDSPMDASIDVAKLFRRQPFELWSEGKICLDLENPSLPLLHVASAEGNMKLLETLADIGVDLNEEDPNGWTALHYAICSGHFESARFLLEKGANIHSYTNKVMNNYCSTVREFIRTNGYSSR